MRNKKADLSMNVIVMAVIAVLIMIVLVFMVINNTSNFGKATNTCELDQQCVEDKTECTESGQFDIAIPKKCDANGVSGKYCCARIS